MNKFNVIETLYDNMKIRRNTYVLLWPVVSWQLSQVLQQLREEYQRSLWTRWPRL